MSPNATTVEASKRIGVMPVGAKVMPPVSQTPTTPEYVVLVQFPTVPLAVKQARSVAVPEPEFGLIPGVGGWPAPPPKIGMLFVIGFDDESAVALLKYGIPPEKVVPETVSGKARLAPAVPHCITAVVPETLAI
jgi:hypothetical protein